MKVNLANQTDVLGVNRQALYDVCERFRTAPGAGSLIDGKKG
jgi:hypothetical protein